MDVGKWSISNQMIVARVSMMTLDEIGGSGDFFISRSDRATMDGNRQKDARNGEDMTMTDNVRVGRIVGMNHGNGTSRRASMWDNNENDDEDAKEKDIVTVSIPTIDASLFVGSTVIGGELSDSGVNEKKVGKRVRVVDKIDNVESTKMNGIAASGSSAEDSQVGRESESMGVDGLVNSAETQKAGPIKGTLEATATTNSAKKRKSKRTDARKRTRAAREAARRQRAELQGGEESLDSNRKEVLADKLNGTRNGSPSIHINESLITEESVANIDEAVSHSNAGVSDGTQGKINQVVNHRKGSRLRKDDVNGVTKAEINGVTNAGVNGVVKPPKLNEAVTLEAQSPVDEVIGAKKSGNSANESVVRDPGPAQLENTSGPQSIFDDARSLLSGGDLVVHSHHGIGRFGGLERVTQGGIVQEFACIEYQDGDVYVPLCMLESLSRPTQEQILSFRRLDSISTAKSYDSNIRTRRARVKHRLKVRSRIREQIVNLKQLYASRDSIHRPRYPVDPVAESRFNRHCAFQLTPDQSKALKEIYRDLSGADRPMDRLLCGDVGYGKTEIAVRAAFRVLQAGKQVAVLAPTTILALQHYETFKNRLQKHYPEFEVGCSTRFTGTANMKTLRADVKAGKVRVLVGTHTILSERTEWKNLGLLVIDEEHRFGVNQKEKIRSRHRKADSLFMSATPIPRTLHLALSGMRDTSVLRKPPPGRKPIVTKVAKASSGTIRKAIENEIARGGQVFYVVPRVEGIDRKARFLQDLFPSAKIMIAHAKIGDLDKRIWKFSHGEYDILLTTTVIENGLDMPSVNTILVADAQYFGLAQLHQLRGRVGRADEQAFAYLLYNTEGMAITDTAVERLKALQRHSGLGAGFALAQRDMEMRGIGQVLGVEQSGNSSIKPDEYSQILHEELEFVRTGEEVSYGLPKTDYTEIFLEVPSIIPDQYISKLGARMRVYTLLAGAQSLMELAKIVRSIEGRYGALPELGRQYVKLLELKVMSKELGIRKIFVEREHVILDWTIGEKRLECLLDAFEDKRTRMRFEAVDLEERVVLRGLGVMDGEGQLTKLREWLKILVRASDKLVGKPAGGGNSLPRSVLLERNFEVQESSKVKATSLA